MTEKKQWKLNADVGEGCQDQLIMPYLDCANIACGAHAGDIDVMQQTLALARDNQVIVGAHPGYPDKENFGRHSLAMSAEELAQTLRDQILLLIHLAREQKIQVVYVKPHGALNHDMLQKPDIFALICQQVADIDKNLVLMVPTNAQHVQQEYMAAQYGLSIWWEVFADRAYEPNGLLRSRQFSDALYSDPQQIVEQLNLIQEQEKIMAIDGTPLEVSLAQTVCVHGDNASSIAAVQIWKN